MRLLIISYYYLLSDSTGSLRPRAMTKYLPSFGVEVSVLTHGQQRNILSVQKKVIAVKNVTRDSSFLPFYYAWRIWQKGLRLIGIYRDPYVYWSDNSLSCAEEIMARAKPDAVLASYPTAAALEIGVTLAERYNVPLISDFRDGVLFEPLETAALEYEATRRHYAELEARAVAASRLILTVSEPISNYFREQYAHPNVMTLHNGYDLDDIAPDMSVELSADIINIVHTGRLGASEKGRGVDALSTALRILLVQSPEMARKFQLHFVGKLSQEEQNCLVPLVAQGIVKLWGHQPRAKALGFQHKADVLLLITAPDKASIATGKLFEYLAANKPILALTRGTEAARIVRETGAGVVASPDNSNEIAAAISSFIQQERKTGNVRNESLIATFSRIEQMKQLAEKLKKI